MELQKYLTRSLICLTGLFLLVTATACSKSKKSSNAAAPAPAAEAAPSGWTTDAASYNGSTLDPHAALNGMGTWVTIGGQQYFVPHASQLGHDWAPYQHGYWTYDSHYGWTWVSYDPWGWMTDHYGVWRHHRIHGWVWIAFEDRKYRPHCVTWFDEGDYVGWYPYYSNYKQYDDYGPDYGFNDGYWKGVSAAVSYASSGASFQLGISLVSRTHVTDSNIRHRLVRDHDVSREVVYYAHRPERIRAGRVGRHPGGDRNQAFDFIQAFADLLAPVGRAERVRSRGGVEIVQPHRGWDVPEDEVQRWHSYRDAEPVHRVRPYRGHDERREHRRRPRG